MPDSVRPRLDDSVRSRPVRDLEVVVWFRLSELRALAEILEVVISVGASGDDSVDALMLADLEHKVLEALERAPS